MKQIDRIDNASISVSNASSRDIDNDFEEDFHQEQGTHIIDDIYMPPPPIQPTNLENQTGKRLIIDTIEVINFKSYGGKKVLGPFYKCFNSIIGPNGSGKSNVIDSMLFVFGYRSQKLRMRKISEVIHNSDQMPNLDYAQVNVNFAMIDDKGDDKQDIIKSSRFTISRVANKDNSSYYMIDSRRVTFANVSQKLQEVGIDLRYNRFLILQGEVEQISLMKPKGVTPNEIGMLEYLEDIIGTSRYKDPIEKLSMKFLEYNEKRTHFVNRVTLAHKELKTFGKAKDEAVLALKLDNQKKIEKAKLIQLHKHKVNVDLEKHLADYREFEDKLKLVAKEEEDILSEQKTIDVEEKDITLQYKQCKLELDQLKEQFQECNKNDYFFNSKLKSAKDNLKKLKSQIIAYNEELERLKDSPSRDKQDIEQLEMSKSTIENDLKEIEDAINSETEMIHQECEDLIKKRNECNDKQIRFKDEQAEHLKIKNDAYNHWMVLKQQADSVRDKYNHIQSKLKQIQDETADKRKMIERYQQEIPSEQQKLNALRMKFGKLENSRYQLTEKINQKSELLQQLKDSLSTNESRDRTKNALMQAKHNGTLHGLFGRLGDLGAIDKTYDVAISTACGRLSNFVVDTIDNAQRCVEFLKENNLPPVTFIALDKLKDEGKWMDKQVNYPEGVPRLFDLVRISEPCLRPAFYFALRETVVAKDIDQAVRITEKVRLRVVTLKGDMIEKDGAMSGGGQPKSGGMGQSIVNTAKSMEQIETLQQEVDELHEERRRIDLEIDNVRDGCAKLENDINFMEDKMKSYQPEVDDSHNRLEQLKQQLLQQQQQIDKLGDNPELEAAKEEYEKAKSIYEKEMSKLDCITEEMKTLDKQMQDKLNTRLAPLKKKRTKLEQALKEKQSKLDSILAEQNSNLLSLNKVKENLENAEKSKQETETEIENIKQQINDLVKTATEIDAKFKQSQQECQIKQEQMDQIKDRSKTCNERLKKLKTKMLELQNEAEKRFKHVKDKQEKLKRLQVELNSIKLTPIDDLENDDEENEMQVDEIPETPPEENLEGDTAHRSHKKSLNQVPILSVEELEDLNPESLERTIKHIDSELSKMEPNFSAIEEYRKKRKNYNQKVEDLKEITSQRDKYLDHLNETKNRREKEFQTGFKLIARKLKEMYRTITLGGDAELEFIDSLDPFSEGIDFSVRPNKKSWKNNSNLSGGEKTIASLALVFALHYYKPSPLYIMDEIDAALDFRNVSIIANYIKARTRNTQFLIISHRAEMFNLAERLIGIYKPFHVSMNITYDPRDQH